MLEFFNINHSKFDLNFIEKRKITNILISENIFKGDRFKFKNKKLNTFMINRFTKSNKLVEEEFNISLNKYLLDKNN